MRLIKIFGTFFKIGLFTIGGGLAMIPIIRDEFVDKQGWLNNEDVTDVLALAQALPGVIAVNASTFVGYKIAGTVGAAVATVGAVLPSFLIIFLIVQLFSGGVSSNIYVMKAFAGINAAITALLFVATVKMTRQVVKTRFAVAVVAGSLIAVGLLKLDIAVVVVSAALVSFVYHRLRLVAGGGRK